MPSPQSCMPLRATIMASLLFALSLLRPLPSAESALATTLQVEVSHAEYMPALDKSLAPGQVYEESSLKGAASSSKQNNWYSIPSWLAGTWHKETQTDYYLYNFVTGTTDNRTKTELARSNGTWGTQIDRSGTIWQYNPAPYSDTVDGGTDWIIQNIRTSEPLESNNTRFVKRTVDTQLRVNKGTGRIVSVETGEQITTYTPLMDGTVRRDGSSKVFGTDGRPLMLAKSVTFEQRISDFKPNDNYRGLDMKRLFRDFLKSSPQTASLID